MNEFQGEYLDFLKHQVDEEIKFLMERNHNTKQNYNPCPFCYEAKDHSYNCNRLNELRQFQSSIAVSLARQVTHARREIAYQPKTVDTTHLQLPQLLQPF